MSDPTPPPAGPAGPQDAPDAGQAAYGQRPPAAPGQPAAQLAAPGVVLIPYVEAHDGPKRPLWIHLVMGRGGAYPPVVGIDGRHYVAVWRTVGFEIPADRPVHVSVHLEGDSMIAAASVLLLPDSRTELTYDTGGMMGAATLR